MAKKQITIEQIETSIARWQTRLRRAVRMVEKLEAQKKRLAKRLASPPVARAVPVAKPSPAPAPAPVKPADDDIPAFLRDQRQPSPQAEAIRAEQADLKRRKARGRIATMKAKQSGETRKMPLTGKAALAAIRG